MYIRLKVVENLYKNLEKFKNFLRQKSSWEGLAWGDECWMEGPALPNFHWLGGPPVPFEKTLGVIEWEHLENGDN